MIPSFFLSLSLYLSVAFSVVLPTFQNVNYDLPPVANTGVYITEWEASSGWQTTNSALGTSFYLKRSLPQLTSAIIEKGEVLVFTKGYPIGEMTVKEKPLALPFYFFAANESASAPCSWLVQESAGEIEVGVQMPSTMESTFEQTKAHVQFRYFLLTESFLKAHQLTPARLHNLSYQQLVQLLAVAP